MLKLQGKSKKTIEAYSRAVRRVSDHFDCCPDKLTPEQLEIYFADLVDSHSWSTVKVDRNGLQFYWRYVLKLDWQWINIIKPPKIHTIPDILTPVEIEQLKAINAILSCRTPDCGEIYVQCTDADCNHSEWRPLSCGHRSCPKCQNHQTSQWIDRQQGKLLPVPYFLATFTLPYQLRSLTWYYQKIVFSIFFLCVSSTLKDFGLNPKNLGAEIGMTMVLHTHNRKLDFHPHMHVVVPGGGVDKRRRQWKKKKGKYLFNKQAMAMVFRARFLTELNKAGFSIPKRIPKKWVVDCSHVGKGITAIKYLSRYLYRGVIKKILFQIKMAR